MNILIIINGITDLNNQKWSNNVLWQNKLFKK